MKDKKGAYTMCNDNFVRTLGFSDKSEILHKTHYELPWKEQADTLVANDKKVLETGQVQKAKEEVILAKDGNVHVFYASKCPWYNEEGTIVGTFGTCADITKIKAMEDALRRAKDDAEKANRAKSTFLANMSHDIRTPLTGMIGLATLLQDNVNSPEHKEQTHMLRMSGEQLLSLMNSILDVVSSDTGYESNPQKSCFNLHAMLQDILELELPSLMLQKTNGI